MSNITSIYNTLLASLENAFPDKTRIPNAYSLSDNNKNFLYNGYGVVIGGSSYEPHEYCSFVVNREINIIFTKEVFRLDSATEEHDDVSISLLENVVTLQSLLYSYNELDINDRILKIDIGSVSGIDNFFNDKQNFLSMTATFNFYIKEEIK